MALLARCVSIYIEMIADCTEVGWSKKHNTETLNCHGNTLSDVCQCTSSRLPLTSWWLKKLKCLGY